MLDKNLRVRRFSSKAAEMFKLKDGKIGERIEILGAEVPELPKLASRVMRRRQGVEKEIVRADGHHYSLRIRPYLTNIGEVEGAVIFLVNIDQIKQAEKERQELSETLASLFESAPDAVMTVNAAGRIERVNGQTERMFGYDRRELIGKLVAKLIPGQFPKAPGKRHADSVAAPAGLELLARRKDGSTFPVEIMLSPLGLAGAEGMIATVRDITERKRVEQILSQSREDLETRVAERTAELSAERTNTVVALEMRARQQAALAGLSQRALEGAVLATLLDEAVRLVPAILGCEFCKVMELLPSGKALFLRAGIGWKKGSVGSVQVATGRQSQEGFTLLSNAPVIVEDLRAEKRFRSPSLLFDRPVVSGLSVIIHGRRQPYGVLAAHTTRRRRFTNDDVHFLQSLANVLAAAIERRELEEELLNISSNEQRRIGQDLHDGLCQHLAGVEFKTAALAKQLAHDPVKGGHAASIVELIRNGARQAWMLARGLSPVTLESHGLMSALRELTANSGKLFQITCRFDCPRPVLVPNNAVATHLYRIAQEAITNAVKHGHARSVVVSFEPYAEQRHSGRHRQWHWLSTRRFAPSRGWAFASCNIGLTRSARPSPSSVQIAKERMSSANSNSHDMKKITVLLADDHIVVREGLRMLVETEGDIEVVGEAKTGREAVDMTLQLHPSVVVMDIAMPLLNGLQATRQILQNGSRNEGAHSFRTCRSRIRRAGRLAWRERGI